jgi:PBSX family phage terminase large subunit
MIARFSKQWFNPLFFIINDIPKTYPNVKVVFIYGGKQSSKTYTISQYCAMKSVTKNQSTLAYRKESTQIKDSIYNTFDSAIKHTRLSPAIKTFEKTFRAKEAKIVFKGLDSERKVKGVEGYSYLIFDELDHFTREEFEEASISFRGEISKLFFCTWNPVSDKLWIKPYLDNFDWIDTDYKLPNPNSFVKVSSCGTKILIRTNYLDNYWAVGSPCGTYGYEDKGTISQYEELKKINYNKYRVVVEGEWGVTEIQNPAIRNFNESRHVGKAVRNASYPLIFSVDFNVSPLLCLVAQEYRAPEHKIRIIEEIRIEHGTTQDLVNIIRAKYTPFELTRSIFTGDASGMNRTTAAIASNWQQLDKAFKLGRRLIIPRANPKVLESLELCDYVFALHPDLLIDESCKTLIFELLYSEKDDNGIIKKNRSKEEQRSDALDCLRYFFNTFFNLNRNIIQNPMYFGIK